MSNFVWQSILRLVVAVLVGSLIGSERARHGRAAGMRTHILVCLGACMTSLTSVYITRFAGLSGDVMRLPAQVISGIGFLGAGMIILKNNNMITGLTTAAGVWTTATIGIALGYGFYTGALAVSGLFLITIIFFARFERKWKTTEVIYLELDDLRAVNDVLNALRGKISHPFSYQIFAPRSSTQGNLGINLVFDRHIELEVSSLTEIPHVVIAVEECQ